MKAIILAGTIPHIAVINNLKRRGYETILVDYNPNCPARDYADKYINESTLDKELILKTAKSEKANLVISIVGDHINAVCCYVAEKLGLPHPYSYKEALNATLKSRMKPLFKEKGIPTPDYCVLDKKEERSILLDFPFVIKPSDANSSQGVFCVNDEAEFYEKIEKSFKISREGKVILEEKISGTEIQADFIVIQGEPHLLMLKDMDTMPAGGFELQTCGFTSPGVLCTRWHNEIMQIAKKIVKAYNYKNGAFFIQAMANENGVFVLEAAIRMAGGSSFESVGLASGTDYVDMAIDGFLGNDIIFKSHKLNKKIVGKFLNMTPGIFEKIDGIDKAIKRGLIDNGWVFVKPGTEITDSHISANRIATIISYCDDYIEGKRKISEALKLIDIFDINGENVSDWK